MVIVAPYYCAVTYYLFWPDAELLENEGFRAVAHVPCVFDGQWRYEEIASRYLRERALLESTAEDGTLVALNARRYPVKGSLKVFGAALCNFLEWCELRGLSLAAIEYSKHLVQGYEAEMLSGLWSASKAGLKPSTASLRVNQAIAFLRWMAAKGLRPEFHVLTYMRSVKADSARSSQGHHALQTEARVGGVRPHPRTLRMPTDEEIVHWRAAVTIEKGPTKALLCELVIRTGIRREEAIQWRINTLPEDRNHWVVHGDMVDVTISYGTKGGKFKDEHGELAGPQRVIQLPLDVALRLDHYRTFVRPAQRAAFVREAPTTEERRARMRAAPNRLFLSDATGEPISAQSLYEAWTQVSRKPFKGWAPHQGRHYWACKTLITALADASSRTGPPGAGNVSLDWITGAGLSIVSLIIQPQLGHISQETSNLYLGWAHRALTVTSIQDKYIESLESLMSNQGPAHG